jgi:carboxyl-terminal processing protease
MVRFSARMLPPPSCLPADRIACFGSRIVAGSRHCTARIHAAALCIGFAALVFTGCATAPQAYVEPAPLANVQRAALNADVFDTTWRLVNEKYFDPQFRGVDWAAMRAKYRPAAIAAADEAALYTVLNRMCGELRESHLTPLPPRRAHEIKTDRRIAVGMVWRILDGKRTVVALVPGGPAESAGVQPGWQIVARDGRPIDDNAAPPVPNSTPVTYDFLDLEGAGRSITFQPQLLKFNQTIARDLPGGYRYLRFDEFDQESLRWLSSQLKSHPYAPGVVLDLRENHGGYVVALQMALSEFFQKRVPTGEFVRRGGRVRQSRGLAFLPARYSGEIVVLTSGATGSAAEIFAHVMQHQDRATVVGRRTAGAVIVARNYPLPGGGQLQIPVQDYRGLDGRRLEGRGVLPDIGVPPPGIEDLRVGRDPDVEMALAALAGDKSSDRVAANTARHPQAAMKGQ